ncbi:MAG: hypothetical protein QN141_05870 [Armatimonadota bacterium]|nr:hypothetical protein [Armatimonadota bacterium]MDR7452249.1 hypothetical protein [Armatimonadota bacterium]MDR7466656.1 hypothetical protein [Armatimonadota bacterium]MDR7492870.1 hypothetical protein [Armatimonadota bacterium]MDR7498646.1 hypothetical protein [Armatimonadota bacterium]
MEARELDAVYARYVRAQRWLRITVIGWLASVAVLVVGWAASMVMLHTGLRLFSSIFALP